MNAVDHPKHYGGDSTYEAIRVIEEWGLDFCLGNAVKYICRAGKKDGATFVEDLEKAAWYLSREIGRFKSMTKSINGLERVRRNMAACSRCGQGPVEVNDEGWCRKCFGHDVEDA